MTATEETAVCKHCGKPIRKDYVGWFHATAPYSFRCFNFPQPDPQKYAEPEAVENQP